MTTLTIIVGLPGSGKTHLTKEVAGRVKGRQFNDMLARDKIPCVGLSGGICSLLISLQDGRNCVVNDIALVYPDKREGLAGIVKTLFDGAVQVEWIYFENDPEQCRINVKADRNRKDMDKRLEKID